MFDRRERAHSRESGFVATTPLHGPVVVGVPRVGEVFRELRAEVLECRERRGEPVVGVEMNGLFCAREIYSKNTNLQKLGLACRDVVRSPLARCRALIMYEYVNNAPPGSRKAARQFFTMLSS